MTAVTTAIRVALLDGQPVLRDVQLRVEACQWTAIVGPNGAGKSTLLRAMAGLIPVEGMIGLMDRPLMSWTPRERARRVAWLGQAMEADEWLVRDVVMLGRLPHRAWLDAASEGDDEAVEQAMQLTQTAALAARRLGSLSAGERQRVRLARAVAVGACVLLLDEPVSHLDPPHQADWVALARQLKTQGHTIVSVLHDLNLALAADRIIVMAQGRVVAHGQAHEGQVHDAIQMAFDHRVSLNHVDGAWRAWLK